MARNHPRSRTRRGANLIEFALTLPVFLTLLAGVIDFSWFSYQRTLLKTSVDFGCRQASLVDPGHDDASLAAVTDRGERATRERLSAVGGDFLCQTGGCDVEIEVIGSPPGRLVRCSASGEYTPIWGMALDQATVRAADIDRLAWQRWPAN